MAAEVLTQALYSILSGAGLVADLVDDRIYPGLIPEDEITYPALIYRVEETIDDETFESSGNCSENVRLRFVSVGGKNSLSGTTAAQRLALALKKQINGLVITVDAVAIQRIQRTSSFDSYDEATETNCVTSDYWIKVSYS